MDEERKGPASAGMNWPQWSLPAALTHEELLAGIDDFAGQIYGHLLLLGITDPMPRQFVLAGLALRYARRANFLPELPRDVVIGTFLFLVPDFER